MTLHAENRWEMLEKIGAYAAGELDGEAAREAERLIIEHPEGRRLADAYARMLAMLRALGEEPVEAPEAVMSYAMRRAYLSAFLRQAEAAFAGLGRSYLEALVYYLGLRPQPAAGR